MRPNRRQEPVRIDLLQPAELLTADGRSTPITFQDLSRDGFKIRHQEELAVDDLVTLTSRRGASVQAQILWVAGQLAGGVFLSSPTTVR